MSYNSEKVKAYRVRVKKRAVEAFGGKCGICGYKRDLAALDFHHLPEYDKGFKISDSNTRSWSSVVKELRKCVLLCSNCHREVHSGTTAVPKGIVRFDEAYAKRERKSKKLKKCLQCGVSTVNKKYCSIRCSSKSQEKADYTTLREDWRTFRNFEKLGRKYGVSGNAIKKKLRRMKIL